MSNLTAIANAAVLSDYQFAPFRRAVDVGGGHGSFLCAILDQHPEASAVLFDLPSVVADSAKAGFITRHQARLELVGGDFFEAVPAGGDLYFSNSSCMIGMTGARARSSITSTGSSTPAGAWPSARSYCRR